ncbi:hypothetical protein CR164_05160 [Prosthecochloris marina]|uniref:Uncharacterized protein n=1 Tax=Prosthecochloris marina TaxID=2017681 RepID=A0A317TA13_9CHLB|nr:hypothetical protein CR164_05160 [Prosthecochloris marina]
MLSYILLLACYQGYTQVDPVGISKLNVTKKPGIFARPNPCHSECCGSNNSCFHFFLINCELLLSKRGYDYE